MRITFTEFKKGVQFTACVKAMRDAFGMALKDVKPICDRIRNGETFSMSFPSGFSRHDELVAFQALSDYFLCSVQMERGVGEHTLFEHLTAARLLSEQLGRPELTTLLVSALDQIDGYREGEAGKGGER